MLRCDGYSMLRVLLFSLILVPGAALAQTSGALDVYLVLPEEITPVPGLGGYGVLLQVDPTSAEVAFVDAIQTDLYGPHPPIFPLGNPFVTPDGGNSIQVSDYLSSVGDEKEIEDGHGLFRVQFQADTGTPGSFDIIVDTVWTGLADGSGNPIPYYATNGRIDILGDGTIVTTPVSLTIVPEPGTLVLLTLGGLTLIRRRRRA